jgi:hypothetical protein
VIGPTNVTANGAIRFEAKDPGKSSHRRRTKKISALDMDDLGMVFLEMS